MVNTYLFHHIAHKEVFPCMIKILLKAHIAHADSKRGWFSNYGNNPSAEDIRFKEGKGNPLHELELGKKYSFDKTFTRLSEIRKRHLLF